MTTSEIANGLPGAAELEALANSMFPDLDAERCSEGIDRLVT